MLFQMEMGDVDVMAVRDVQVWNVDVMTVRDVNVPAVGDVNVPSCTGPSPEIGPRLCVDIFDITRSEHHCDCHSEA